MSAIFDADAEGFRALQLGRLAAHLVRELIQNVLDEAASRCTVTVKHGARGVTVVVEDDVLGGIRDEKLVFTIWASDKQDTHTKRGRMGRGLKELISVSERTVVATQGRPAIVFRRQDGEWSRSHTTQIESPSIGTRVEATVKSWGAKEAKAIIEYLKKVRPPQGISFTVNGDVVARRPVIESHTLSLDTVVFITDEGERKVSNPRRETTVELFAEEQTWVYEMGIPIEPIEYPLSIDIGQRVPLREQRDTMLSSFARTLYAKLLNVRIAHIPKEQLKDNHVLRAAEDAWELDPDVRKAIADAWTDGKPYASTPELMSIATGQHVPVVNLRSLPEAIRTIVHNYEAGVNVKGVLEARRAELCPELTVDLTDLERRFIDTWQWIARGVQRPCRVVLRDGEPGALASFDRKSGELSIYVKPAWLVAKDYFAWPLKGTQLSTLIHELSHWTALEESHGEKFTSDAEDVGGAVAQFLLEHADEALARARQGWDPSKCESCTAEYGGKAVCDGDDGKRHLHAVATLQRIAALARARQGGAP